MAASRPDRIPHQAEKTLAYGTPEFRMASELAVRTAHSGRVRGLVGCLVNHPRLPEALLAVRRLPVVEAVVTPEEEATWRSPYFAPATHSIFYGYRAQAVLDLRTDDAEYLAGRRKQALRTNLHRARDKGVQVAGRGTYEEWFDGASEVLRARDGGTEVIAKMRPPAVGQQMGYFVAWTDEQPIAFAGVALFGHFGVVCSLLSRPGHPASSSARYLLHTFMRSELRDRGIRHLVAGSAVRETAGNQYFQFLLGYEVRNLVITVDPHPAQILNLVRPGSSCGQGGAPEVGDSQLKESANS